LLDVSILSQQQDSFLERGGGLPNSGSPSRALLSLDSRSYVLKLIFRLFAVAALIGIVGCSKSSADLNKSLKPVDAGSGKPHAVKDMDKGETGHALK
jgi:hypothetical protein